MTATTTTQSTSPAARPPASLRYAEIAETASEYLDAVRAGSAVRLGAVMADIWHGKRCGVSEVVLEERADCLARIGSRAGLAYEHELTAIAASFIDFAMVRADDRAGFGTSFLILFNDRGAWKVAGEARSVDVERDVRFVSRTTERAVLNVLEEYYRSVTASDKGGIRRIFAPCWHMKNHEGGVLVCEGVDAFVERLDNAFPAYWDDRQIADVQIAGNRLAYVRVDRPSTPSTTIFFFANYAGEWKMIDKAWTDGRKPID
jgi:hypothetical protein